MYKLGVPMTEEIYDQTLLYMELSHKALAARVCQPTAVLYGNGYVFRYKERDVHQALVQKLARVISGLHAARLLLTSGIPSGTGRIAADVGRVQPRHPIPGAQRQFWQNNGVAFGIPGGILPGGVQQSRKCDRIYSKAFYAAAQKDQGLSFSD